MVQEVTTGPEATLRTHQKQKKPEEMGSSNSPQAHDDPVGHVGLSQ